MEPRGEARAQGRPSETPERPARTRLGLGWTALAGGILLGVAVMLLVWWLI